MPEEDPYQERFESIAAAYLAESDVESLTSIRYDIVSPLVTDSEKALLRHHKTETSKQPILCAQRTR